MSDVDLHSRSTSLSCGPARIIVTGTPDRVGTVHFSKPSCILPQEIEGKHLLTSRWIVTVFLSGFRVYQTRI